MVNLDIYATVAAITGVDLPTGYTMDSLDMSGVLFRGDDSPRTSYLFFSSGHWDDPFSYRSGHYNIHFRTNEMLRDPITGDDVPVTEYDPPLLFDLKGDRPETTSIAHDKPEVLKRMIEEYHAMVKEITRKNEAQ